MQQNSLVQGIFLENKKKKLVLPDCWIQIFEYEYMYK